MKRALALPVLALAAIALVSCGDDSSSSSDTTAAASETTSAPSETTTAPVSAAPAGPLTGGETLAVADVGGEVGTALVGPDGHTLYLFEQDDGTTSACTESCAEIWPGLVADGAPVGGEGVDASLLGTADGQVPDQVTYNGHLLYEFSGDSAPGDVNGLQIPEWYPVDASGESIDVD